MQPSKPKGLLWGSGYSKIGADAVDFCSSGDFAADLKLFDAELAASKAHAYMLHAQKLISDKEADGILAALEKLEKAGPKALSEAEDIHSAVDACLNANTQAGNFRLALSRNDQVVSAEHLFLQAKASEFSSELKSLAKTLATKAIAHKNDVMSGYTHYQQAQPTTFGHLLLAYAFAFARDAKKFECWVSTHDSFELGAVTGFGTTLQADPQKTAKMLGFSKAKENSLDAVANRWELEADFAYCIASTMTHLSTLAHTLILFTTSEFGYVSLGDKYSTGSSAMPHKKNPDVLEAIKGKTSEAQSSLFAIMTNAKSNLVGYNKDTQWGKHEVLEAIGHALPSLEIMSKVIEGLKVDKKKMLASLSPLTCTLAVAENVAKKHNVPFKQAKQAVEKAIAKADAKGKKIFTADELNECIASAGAGASAKVSPVDLELWFSPQWVVEHTGANGPNPAHVEAAASKLIGSL
jgi:argininosuccinate lyase